MAPKSRNFSPATCLVCRQPFSAQLAIACTVEDTHTDAPERSFWRRMRDRLGGHRADPGTSEAGERG